MIIELNIPDGSNTARCLAAVVALYPTTTKEATCSAVLDDCFTQAIEDFELLQGYGESAEDFIAAAQKAEMKERNRLKAARKLVAQATPKRVPRHRPRVLKRAA